MGRGSTALLSTSRENVQKRVFFQYITIKMITITYLYQFLTLLEPPGRFFILDSRHPEIQKCPGIGWFWPISMYWVFFPLNFCQGTWFLMQNSNFPSVLETSRNFLELWILPGNSLFQANFDIMGINSTVFLSLNMNLASKIEKCHVFCTSGSGFQTSRSAWNLLILTNFYVWGTFST